MNARGIPIAVYQVLHLLPEVGTPWQGYPPPARSDWGEVPKVGYPLAGIPLAKSDRGTQGGYPLAGVPPARSDGVVSWGGVPPARSDGGTWGGIPPRGTPQLDLAGVPPWLDLAGVPPL